MSDGLAVERDPTLPFVGAVVLLSIAGAAWAVVAWQRTAELREAIAGARAEMVQLQELTTDLATLRARGPLVDQGAIRSFLMGGAGLRDLHVGVEQREDGEDTLHVFTVTLPRHTRRTALGYVHNVRTRAPGIRLIELRQQALADPNDEAAPDPSAPPTDEWRWTLVFAVTERGAAEGE